MTIAQNFEDAKNCSETIATAYSSEMQAVCCQKFHAMIQGCDDAEGQPRDLKQEHSPPEAKPQKQIRHLTEKQKRMDRPHSPPDDDCAEASAAGYSQEMRLYCCSRHIARIEGCLQWDGAAIGMGVLVACFAMLCVGTFWCALHSSLSQGSLSDLSTNLIPTLSRDDVVFRCDLLNRATHHDWVHSLCRAQGLLNRLMLLVGILVVLATGHSSASPAITGAVVLPSIARSRYIEYGQIRSGLRGEPVEEPEITWNDAGPLSWNDAGPLFFGCLENLDDFSDGAVIGAMILQDAVVHPRFVGSFLYSSSVWVRALAPAMDMIHMFGLALLWLLLGQAAQWSITLLGETVNATMLESVGFNALSEREADSEGKALFLGLTRVLLENCSSGLLAGSFIMFTGVDDLLEQPIGLVSAILSAAALCKKSVDIFSTAIATAKRSSAGVILFECILGLALGLIGAWITAKLWFIQTCPDHAWELTAGCMNLD